MVVAILITALIIAALLYALRGGRATALIARHTYNNQYNDATAAREDRLG